MAKVGIFVDISNIYYCVRKEFNQKVDYLKYLKTSIGDNQLFCANAYGAQIGVEATSFLECLRTFGYEPKYKAPKEYPNPEYVPFEIFDEIATLINQQPDLFPIPRIETFSENLEVLKRMTKTKKDIRKADWDVGLAIDVVRVIGRIDKAVIGSADGDLVPLVRWAKEQGCRCTIFACNISKELKEIADEIIEIDQHVLESR